jgi:hypothetical protein
MTRIAIPGLLLAAFAAGAQEVTFAAKPRAVGATWTQAQDFLLALKLSVTVGSNAAQVLEQRAGETTRFRTTVLAVSDTGLTSVKVSYLEATARALGVDGKEVSAPKPHSGKTYIVKKEKGELLVTDENQQPVPADEAELVKEDHQELGEVEPHARFFDKRAVRVGERVVVPGEAARELLGIHDEHGQVELLALTLKEIRPAAAGSRAVFDMEVNLTQAEADGPKMTLKPTGEMVIGVENCRPVSTNLTGPVEVTPHETQGPQVPSMQGTGTVKVNVSVEEE